MPEDHVRNGLDIRVVLRNYRHETSCNMGLLRRLPHRIEKAEIVLIQDRLCPDRECICRVRSILATQGPQSVIIERDTDDPGVVWLRDLGGN
jgi:hypothetical protein